MKIDLRFAPIALVGILAFGTSLSASTIFYTNLSGANEVPATNSAGSGYAMVTLNNDSLTVMLGFSGLGSPAQAGHIHCCGMLGINEPVAVPFSSLPTGVTSGMFTSTIDLTSSAVYTSAFLASNGGTASSAEAALIAGMNAGMTYVNIHTTVFPGGEIRGELAATPEPATLFLTAGVLAGLSLLKARKLRA